MIAIRTGDALAVSGPLWSPLSALIRVATWSKISHIAVCYDAVTVVESTSMNGFDGVIKRPLHEFLYQPRGVRVWHCGVMTEISEEGKAAAKAFLDSQVGRQYDAHQALLAGLDIGGKYAKYFLAEPDVERWFCSEIWYHTAELCGLVEHDNEAELTPRDVWHLSFRVRSRLV